jgi:hypothetical protein
MRYAVVEFAADDPYGLWAKGDRAEDLGWESEGVPIRLLRLLRDDGTGQVLALTSPYSRGLIRAIAPRPTISAYYDVWARSATELRPSLRLSDVTRDYAVNEAAALTANPLIRSVWVQNGGEILYAAGEKADELREGVRS